MNFYRSFITTCLLVTAIVLMASCSGNDNQVAPSVNSTSDTISNGNLGEFTLALDLDTLSAEIEPVIRQSAIDVTNFVNISITNLSWDPAKRFWDITVDIENPTMFDAHGPWIVFTNIGQQKIVEPDGFLNMGHPSARYPVIAFAKENTERVFAAHSTEQVNFQIYWPAGWSSFFPMEFYIDVSWPGARQQPIVEDLSIEGTPIPENFIINAFIKDWQKDPAGIQYAWLDLRPIGGPQYHQMFDDGAHGDGAPQDDIWGINFMAIRPDPPVFLTVHAIDYEGYQFENDILFGVINEGPCQPVELMEEGSRSKIQVEMGMIARNQQELNNLWDLHAPGMEPPVVNFNYHMVVAVFLGVRPTSGYSVDIDCIRFSEPPMENMVYVDYTENIPDPGTCITMPATSTPYQIVLVQQYMGADNFFGEDEIYYCD